MNEIIQERSEHGIVFGCHCQDYVKVAVLLVLSNILHKRKYLDYKCLDVHGHKHRV